ncbi:aminopeptidase N [Coxiella endosymbiont of Amblyomma sculptum]|uniref:aminopeptidase N n=1 Tax=Coxiella endosymbiont of Amblyomma sculptum TaxID=2487929 RepID=UPI00132F2FD2|nr:aminopeptidase N [Coxiella endosymbiont of Amblyomma sculptum]QHG92707.1 aminopeptidase N [Coxiella endosymbiont of Amblyomma sculptum]
MANKKIGIVSRNSPTYLKDYRPPGFLIDTMRMHVDLYEEETNVRTVLNLRRNPKVDVSKPLVLNGEEMVLKCLSLDGRTLSSSEYQITDSLLIIPRVPDSLFTLETKVTIKPQENTQLIGLYKSKNVFCSQCEPYGFRRITYFLDRPDVLTRYTTTITADKDRYPFLLSNGNLIESKMLCSNRQWVHWEDPLKKPSYLFALVAGDFDVLEDVFFTRSDRKIILRLFLEKGLKHQGFFALQSLKRAMKWDEERFGREYDLKVYMIVAVGDFNTGAMENKGINIFNAKNILADPKTATDEDYMRIENVIGHEYFHNWSGNRVTCRDWFQISLKEGLTVFRDQCFSEDITSRATARIRNVNYLRNVQFLEDSSPTAHPVRPNSYIEINNCYTSTIYNKGAEVIRMIRTLLGSKIFRKGMDLYFSRYDGQAVTIEDFVQAMMDVSSKNFEQFKKWYDHIGTPILDMESEYDQEKEVLILKVRQSCSSGSSKKLPLHIPLALGLLNSEYEDATSKLDGDDNFIRGTRVLEIKKSEEVFKFLNVKKKPILSLLRDFSAPVYSNYPYSDEELLQLFQHDSDPFSRWESGQIFSRRLIGNLIKDYQQKRSLKLDDRFVESFRDIVVRSHGDYGYAALLILLPSETGLMQFIQNTDVETIYSVRQFVKRELAKTLVLELTTAYERHRLPSYTYNWIDVGKRAFKNRCLNYLTENAEDKQYALAYRQFRDSDNMTDVIGSLSALVNHECKERDRALDEFYRKWKDHPLVVNKWMALQASSKLPSTTENVKRLLQHPAFNIKNPNNVYSLLVTFGMNTVCFHDKNGEGYRLISDCVLNIDAINPQMAARVLQPLSNWKIMDEGRQELMKTELNRIAKVSRSSSGVYEIITKSLNSSEFI